MVTYSFSISAYKEIFFYFCNTLTTIVIYQNFRQDVQKYFSFFSNMPKKRDVPDGDTNLWCSIESGGPGGVMTTAGLPSPR